MNACNHARKFSVFLSSCSKDLGDIRMSLVGHTLASGHVPVSMDLFVAASQTVKEVIEDRLNSCDIFVQILGNNYGTRAEHSDKSYTELEYEAALRKKLPVLSFLLRDEEYSKDASSDGDALDKFRTRVRDGEEPGSGVVNAESSGIGRRVVKFFSLKNTAQLYVDYLLALLEQTASMSAGGWVREAQVREALELNETIRKNDFFLRYVERLKSFTTLSQRTRDNAPEKQAMAQFFWNRYLPRLVACRSRRLFFESGSTLAYSGFEFIQRLRKPWVRDFVYNSQFESIRSRGLRDRNQVPRSKLRSMKRTDAFPRSESQKREGLTDEGQLLIYTNNILIYLDFALAETDTDPVKVRRYPVGPADPYYGATFGQLTSLVEMLPPRHKQKLTDRAKHEVDRIATFIRSEFEGSGLILMTASGLETSSKSQFCGPHVGSYYNMLIKRALLQSQCSAVLFLDASKVLEKQFRVGKCFAVCDDEMKWEVITKKQPIAIATCGRTEDERKRLCEALETLGFDHHESEDLGGGDEPTGAIKSGRVVGERISSSGRTRLYPLVVSNHRFHTKFCGNEPWSQDRVVEAVI